MTTPLWGIEARKEKAAQDAVENHLIDKVIENMEAEIPACMYEHRIDQSVREFEYRLQSQGMKLETYLQYTNMELDAFRKTFAEQAEKQVKIRLALEKIVELEHIEIAPEDVEKEFENLAGAYGMTIEDVKKAMPEADLVSDLAVNKAIDIVRDSAVITTEKAQEEKEEKKETKPKKKKAKDPEEK